MRSKNANAGVTARDGTFYAGVGGGLVGSAANFRAICWGDWQLKTAQDAEAAMRAYDLESLADKVAEKVGTRPERLACRLAEIEGSDAYIVIDGAEFSVNGTIRPFVVKIAFSASLAGSNRASAEHGGDGGGGALASAVTGSARRWSTVGSARWYRLTCTTA